MPSRKARPARKSPAAERPLTVKEKAFVERHLVHGNGAQAVREAGYRCKDAAGMAYELLGRPLVQKALQAARADLSKRNELDADWVLGRLRKEALSRRIGSSHAARVRALELIGKQLGMFKEKVEHDGELKLKVSLDDLLEARKKLDQFRRSLKA